MSESKESFASHSGLFHADCPGVPPGVCTTKTEEATRLKHTNLTVLSAD